jgi:hypothetical protein
LLCRMRTAPTARTCECVRQIVLNMKLYAAPINQSINQSLNQVAITAIMPSVAATHISRSFCSGNVIQDQDHRRCKGQYERGQPKKQAAVPQAVDPSPCKSPNRSC